MKGAEDMLPKKKEEPPPGIKKVQTYDKITIDISERQFSLVQTAELVKLRVFSDIGNITFLLRNANNQSKNSGNMGQLSLELDGEKFLELLNPQLKVVFRSSNVLAPFFTSAMYKESFFSVSEPMGEAIRRSKDEN